MAQAIVAHLARPRGSNTWHKALVIPISTERRAARHEARANARLLRTRSGSDYLGQLDDGAPLGGIEQAQSQTRPRKNLFHHSSEFALVIVCEGMRSLASAMPTERRS